MRFVKGYSEVDWRGILSGQREDPLAFAARGLLTPLSWLYRIAVSRRNARFSRDPSLIHHALARVISVGNLTTGGTGKTPFVIWLCQFLRDEGVHVAIVSRGYGAQAGEQNDEAKEIACRLPEIPHLQNPNRFLAAQEAVQRFQSQVIVLDDGFQHRRLFRDLDIVLIDATCPWGYGKLLPRGLLREPISGLSRAAVVVLTRADRVDEAIKADIQREVQKNAPHAVWLEASHAPVCLVNAQNDYADLTSVAGKRVFAFCAVGNPASFRQTLQGLGGEIVSFQEFADHHHFTSAEIAGLATRAQQCRSEMVLCTHKDLVKVLQHEIGGLPLWGVQMDLRFLAGEENLKNFLKQTVLKQDAPNLD